MKILFICDLNISRSQIAETFFNHFSKKHYSKSAGTEVNDKNGELIKNVGVIVSETMSEEGFDLSNKVRTQLTPAMAKDADMIVAFTIKESLPDFIKNSSKLEIWNVEDPTGKDFQFHKRVRDHIKTMVKQFVEQID